MNRISPLLLVLSVTSLVMAADKSPFTLPATADSLAAIRKAAGEVQGFGHIQSAHFDLWEQEIFVLWCCPFSGRDSCFVDGYNFDSTAKQWKRFFEDLIDHSHDLSVALPYGQQAVVISDVHGKEVRRVDVSKLPRERPEEQRETKR